MVFSESVMLQYIYEHVEYLQNQFVKH